LVATGLKEADSSVEIYVEKVLREEVGHEGACTHGRPQKTQRRHMHVNNHDSTGKGTDHRDQEV